MMVNFRVLTQLDGSHVGPGKMSDWREIVWNIQNMAAMFRSQLNLPTPQPADPPSKTPQTFQLPPTATQTNGSLPLPQPQNPRPSEAALSQVGQGFAQFFTATPGLPSLRDGPSAEIRQLNPPVPARTNLVDGKTDWKRIANGHGGDGKMWERKFFAG